MNNIEKKIGSQYYNALMNLNLFSRCFILVSILFKDKKDKAGEPYIYHLIRVSASMYDKNGLDGMLAGLLHDVVEDIDGITFLDLKSFGVPDNVIEAIKLVTNDKNIEWNTYSEKLKIYNDKIDRIINSGNVLAINLKYCDMSDNFDPLRIQELPLETQSWFQLKYEKNIEKLRSIVENNKKLVKVRNEE